MFMFDMALEYRHMYYEIHFFPERDGIRGSSWNPGEEGPDEKTYVHDIVSWVKRFRPAVRNGTQNLLQ